MPIEFDDVLERGGNELIQFLHFCVYSVNLTPLFVALARDYRFRPTICGALTLHSTFCAVNAPARIKADPVLAPNNLRLDQLVMRLKKEVQEFEDAAKLVQSQAKTQAELLEMTGTADKPRRMPAVPSPLIFLFDDVIKYLQEDLNGPLHSMARAFNPAIGPMQNLPDGRLNSGQRAFVEYVWRPRLRPQLVAAGFSRAANLGQ